MCAITPCSNARRVSQAFAFTVIPVFRSRGNEYHHQSACDLVEVNHTLGSLGVGL